MVNPGFVYPTFFFANRFSADRSQWLVGPDISSDNTNSLETLQFVQASLRNCLQNHNFCGAKISHVPWRPTRLLKLDHPSKNQIALLNHLEAFDEDFSNYITLSHCWGQGELIQLTSLTYPSLAKGFYVNALPRTFQDAIKITRSLGVSFIWIDSLCIFQDSKEDWGIEASR